jgi:histone-binding protein RBBP4
MAEEYETENEAEVEEEFSVWKRNTPLLYDLFISHPLAWPSLTVQWLPSPPQPHSNSSFNLHKLLLATHTSDEEPNYLMLAESTLPGNPSQPVIAADPENPILPKVFDFFSCFCFICTNCLMKCLNDVCCLFL